MIEFILALVCCGIWTSGICIDISLGRIAGALEEIAEKME